MTTLHDLPQELYGGIARALVPPQCDGEDLVSTFQSLQCFSGINRAAHTAAREGMESLLEATGTDTVEQLQSLYNEETFRAHLRPFVVKELVHVHEFSSAMALAVRDDAVDFVAATFQTRQSLARACTYDINIYSLALSEWVVQRAFGPRFKIAEDLLAELVPTASDRRYTQRQWAVWGWQTVHASCPSVLRDLPPVCRALIENAMGASGPGENRHFHSSTECSIV